MPDPAALHRELRAIAEQAARAGGAVARRMFESHLTVEFKADGSEVSEADHAAQAETISAIQATRPNDVFIAEETLAPAAPPRIDDRKKVVAPTPPRAPEPSNPGCEPGAPGSELRIPDAALQPPHSKDSVIWAIDPIDGTRNYLRRLPFFCCSVAAIVAGRPVAGAVYEPMRDSMFAAAEGEGCFLNGRPVCCSPGDARPLLVAIPSKLRRAGDIVRSWKPRLVVRNFGSTALHLAMVAAGLLDASLANDARLWDIAAGWLLVTAGGGVVTGPDGAAIFPRDVSSYAGEEIPTLAAGSAVHGMLVQGA